MEPSPSPWDGQRLPDEVGGRGINLFWSELSVVKDGDWEVPLDLGESSLSVPWIPGSHGVVGVIVGVSIRNIAPWVSVLGTPYVPHRGTWVLKFGCWGAALAAGPQGSISGRDVLPTQKVFVGGGTPNRERSPVKGTGGSRCANGCQIRTDCWSLLLEAGDNIVGGEWCVSEIGSGNPPSSKESQSLQVSADLLCAYEREDQDGGESHGNSDGYA